MSCLAVLLALAGCGGGGGSPPSADQAAALSGTLAYVVSECRGNADGSLTTHHELRIRQGHRSPVTVAVVPGKGPRPRLGPLCDGLNGNVQRAGLLTVAWGPFQRLGVTQDASVVVFELTDAFSQLGRHFLTPEQEGIFFVRSDGTGLRRLGPPSQEPAFFPLFGAFDPELTFSPDGHTLAFPDRGPGPEGIDASQIMTIDLDTGARTQVTHLPRARPAPDLFDLPGAVLPAFLDNQTVVFISTANPDELKSADNPGGVNPEGHRIVLSVNTDGSGLEAIIPLALPGAEIDPSTFVITGDRPSAVTVTLPGQAVNPIGARQLVREVFLVDGQNVVQLTNFRRAETFTLLGLDQGRVFFEASADPFGTNRSENCQIFSIDRTGTDLRQLTNFHDAEHSAEGCLFNLPTGCSIDIISEDPKTHTLVFYSSCDPVGRNPNGGQIFAVRTDGTGVDQLTETHGLATEPDGTFIAELPGPYAYSPGF